jgi:hypothetical protein
MHTEIRQPFPLFHPDVKKLSTDQHLHTECIAIEDKELQIRYAFHKIKNENVKKYNKP